MKRKLLLLTGLGIGYVLGARAGREKYDRITAAAAHYWRDPRVAKVRDDVEIYARTQAPIIRDRAEIVAKDVATKTAATAKDVASKTQATAKDIADKTSATAKDVAGRVSGAADDVKGQVAKTAAELKDRSEEAVERATLSVGEARDRALELDDDEDDELEGQVSPKA
jgi:gas vesicle protein